MTTHASTSFLPDHHQHLLQTVVAAPVRDLDDLLGQVYAANVEGRLTDTQTEQLGDAARARRTVLLDRRNATARARVLARQARINGMRPLVQVERDAERRRSICLNRPKTFGMGRPKPMSARNKRRLMERARALVAPTEPGKHYGELTPKYVRVLEVLLYVFHNNSTGGLCFPSYEEIAAAAPCARSTVGLALIALEEAGLLSWDHRIKRVFATVVDLFGAVTKGQRSEVQRSSNAYTFFFDDDDADDKAKSSKSELKSGSTIPFLKKHSSLAIPVPAPSLEPDLDLLAALGRFENAVKAKSELPPVWISP
jgi:helix-turn-helix protein